jgi:hypothetical protein
MHGSAQPRRFSALQTSTLRVGTLTSRAAKDHPLQAIDTIFDNFGMVGLDYPPLSALSVLAVRTALHRLEPPAAPGTHHTAGDRLLAGARCLTVILADASTFHHR